jgi:hypothetical protein
VLVNERLRDPREMFHNLLRLLPREIDSESRDRDDHEDAQAAPQELYIALPHGEGQADHPKQCTEYWNMVE